MTVSEKTLNEAREQAGSIILTLYKPRMVNSVSQNPGINVLVIQVPEAQWKDVNMDAEIEAQLADIKVSLPGTKVKTNFLPLERYPEIHNYSGWIPTKDNTVTQHLYTYWRPP